MVFLYIILGDFEKAKKLKKSSIDVTPIMAFEFVKILNLYNIEYIVARIIFLYSI